MATPLATGLPPNWINAMALVMDSATINHQQSVVAGVATDTYTATYAYHNADYNVTITITPK